MMMAGGDGDSISPLLAAGVETCVQTFHEKGDTMIKAAIENAHILRAAMNHLPGF